MSAPLPAQAAADEWQQHLQDLSDRAEKMLKSRTAGINEHAQLAVDALKVLWSGWTPELVYASCQASLAVKTAVVTGRPVAWQLQEIEDHLQDFYEQSQQQPMAPDPVSIMLPELLLPPGSLPEPSEPKPVGRRRRTEPEGEPDPIVEPDPDPVVLPDPEPVAELPDLWNEQDQQPPTVPFGTVGPNADEQQEAEPVALWPAPDPELAITFADLPETISAVQVASWWGVSVSQVHAWTSRRGVLGKNVHWRKSRRGIEHKGNRYYVSATFSAISAATGQPIPEHPLQTVEQALQPRRPGRRERRIQAEKVLAELVG
jgi:hypothetical protein